MPRPRIRELKPGRKPVAKTRPPVGAGLFGELLRGSWPVQMFRPPRGTAPNPKAGPVGKRTAFPPREIVKGRENFRMKRARARPTK